MTSTPPAPVVSRLDIDLRFTVSNGEAGSDDGQLSGTVTAAGLDIGVYLDRPDLVLPSGTGTGNLPAARSLAAQLAALGLTVTLSGPTGMIARVGAVRTSFLQRALTGSRHIQIGSLSSVRTILPRAGSTGLIALPPSTPAPLAPTFARRIRRRITTTHHSPGTGRPRLIFVVGSRTWDGTPPREFDLLPTVTTIGSGPEADLRLAGLDEMHAEIRHDERDEYVLFLTGGEHPIGMLQEPRSGAGKVLRTGARIELGPWRMGYFREEYADHGRPHGGRTGGEFTRQKPQIDPRPKRR